MPEALADLRENPPAPQPRAWAEPSWFCENTSEQCRKAETVLNTQMGYFGVGAWACGYCNKRLKNAPEIQPGDVMIGDHKVISHLRVTIVPRGPDRR